MYIDVLHPQGSVTVKGRILDGWAIPEAQETSTFHFPSCISPFGTDEELSESDVCYILSERERTETTPKL